VSTSQCPFAHQAGLSSLASSTSNLINSMRQQPTSSSTASGSTIQRQQQQQLLSGHGWAVVGAESASGLPAVPGRWCWNPLLGDMLALEAQGAGPFLLQRYRLVVDTCVLVCLRVCWVTCWHWRRRAQGPSCCTATGGMLGQQQQQQQQYCG
jgi:hypothetical protein